MLCDRCKKRDAKIYYTEVVNGEMKEQHLCEECAAECTQFHMNSTFVNKDISIGDILSSILGTYRGSTNQKADQGKNGNTEEPTKEKKTDHTLRCENCGMTYEQFLKEGKFGCHQCYHYFNKILSRSLKSLHGADAHVGKHPKGYVSDMKRIINELSEVEKMSILLQEAIEKEEFEEAARLRDAIRALKEKEREKQQDNTQPKKDEVNKEEINNA
ncbi:UvrB/UvrC motif-containing protein [Anaerosporobacter faecicola]|uniref:UvrB/UvrC motif-containing protein n=1 Tax=Anaerosporobacter faecicola TaxID=2718714 RepID=UPI00143BFCE3|nr:UvrB/UvrC motif-containing protein [Anaerosporobacter faecicola]